jgi:hypothetical protein
MGFAVTTVVTLPGSDMTVESLVAVELDLHFAASDLHFVAAIDSCLDAHLSTLVG